MKKYIFTIFILISSLLYSNTFKVADIRIDGLKRTKRSTVLKIIDVNEGDEIDTTSLEPIKQKLLEAGIFTPDITLSIIPVDESYAKLFIYLTDKWTFIPLPFLSFSEDSFTLGGIFIESNLLGLQHSLVLGTIYSDDDLTGFTSWKLPEFDYGTLSLSLSFYSGDSKIMNFDGDILKGDEAQFIAFGPSYTLPLFSNSDIKTSFRYKIDKDENHILLNNDLAYKKLTYTETFTKGLNLNLEYRSDINLDQSLYYKGLTFKGSYSNMLFSHLIFFDFKSGYNFDKDDYYLLFGAKKGSLVIPKNLVRSNRYTTGHLAIELKLIEFIWGYLTFPIFYEAGLVNIVSVKDDSTYHGPGLGVNLYMKKVAIPAMGLFYVYDIPNDRYNFTFSIGASF